MTLLVRRLLDRAARWFLTRRPQPLDVRPNPPDTPGRWRR